MASPSQLQEILDFVRTNQRQIFDKITGESKIDILLTAQAQNYASAVEYPLDKKEIEYILNEVKISEGIKMEDASIVSDGEKFEEWLEERKRSLESMMYWDEYKKHLESQGLSKYVLSSIDNATDRILKRCCNPKDSNITSRRGMVVGSVQSGKTANYIGLLTKAADYGYKIIIIIAGINETLRQQTQYRVNEGFVSEDMSRFKSIGIQKRGITRDHKSFLKPRSYTTESRDFYTGNASVHGTIDNKIERPAVFVVKKNKDILNNLYLWLKESGGLTGSKRLDMPALVIDDEADNASINIAYSKNDVSMINRLIRQINGCFTKSTYIGYTATPFANIFIDPDSWDEACQDDLFPRHFIVGLEPPQNYVGPQRLFTQKGDLKNSIIHIYDNEDYVPQKHDKYLDPILPPSLIEALNCYIISDAIKHHRGIWSNNSSSMLINVSTYQDVHYKLKVLIEDELRDIQASIRACCGMDESNDDYRIRAIKVCYQSFFNNSGADWNSIRYALLEVYKRFEVKVINSKSTDSLNKENNDNSSNIVIGGFSLSRGLTLDGLTISYFIRNSRMYDTLLQMGRWFGYRKNYEDITRIWMTNEAQDNFSQITNADQELRDDLRQLEKTNSTPMDFGLRVRTHPESLQITAKNKMGSSRIVVRSINLAGRFIETSLLPIGNKALLDNIDLAKEFIRECQADGYVYSRIDRKTNNGNGFLAKSVDASLIIRFIRDFKSMSSLTCNPMPIQQYVGNNIEDGLGKWDVYIPSINSNCSKKEYSFDIKDVLIGLQERACFIRQLDKAQECITVNLNGKVSGTGIEKVGLTRQQVTHIECENDSTNDSIYRVPERNPLLIIHFLKSKVADDIKMTDSKKERMAKNNIKQN